MHMIILDSGISEYQKDILTVDIGHGTFDENGHGTKIVDITSKIANFAKITSIRILNRYNECSLSDLLNALEVCADIDADVLCMSIVVEGNGKFRALKKLVDHISHKGTLIVAPLHNRKNFSIPAAYNNVVGVQAVPVNAVNASKFAFYSEKSKIQCQIPLSGIVCKTRGNSYSYFAGNSCACAFFSSELLCRLRVRALSSVSDVNRLYREIKYEDSCIYPYLHPDTSCYKSDTFALVREQVIDTLEKCNYNWGSTNSLLNEITSIDLLVNRLNDIGLKINNSSFLSMSDLENVDKLTHYLCTQNQHLT